MIENFNESHSGEFSAPRYVGVSSIKILAINPDTAKLKSLGWNIADDADEPKYVTVNEHGEKSSRIRFMVKILDLDSAPIIPMDFWVRDEPQLSAEKPGEERKCKVIDSYGRTAMVTKEELKGHKIPQWSNGPASISPDYKICHRGEDSLVQFLMKWLNMTPYEVFRDGSWVKSEKPGRLTIDNWKALCEGDIKEVAEAISIKPDNRCKVIFGVNKTDDNKTYQAFYPNFFMANGARCNLNGLYPNAQKILDKYYKNSNTSNIYEASVVHEYKEQATEVKESSQFEDDLPFLNS